MSLALALQKPTIPFAHAPTDNPDWYVSAHQEKVLKNLPFLPRLLLGKLRQCQYGKLLISLPNGTRYGIAGPNPGIAAKLRIQDWRVLDKIFWQGDLGLAQAYIDNLWQSDDLTGVLSWGSANAADLFGHMGGKTTAQLWRLWQHLGRQNSRAGSRRNIMAHYDLGNEFYAAWLDPSMTYSAAVFDGKSDDLYTAQQNKYLRLLDGLALRPRSHILEIGCGWGGFVEYILRHTQHRITAVTISPAQFAYARARIAGLPDAASRAEIVLRDYRDLRGQYDGIVSIEMFEAVGEKYWPVYARQLFSLLKPKSRAALQMITIADDRFAAYRRNPDFIQQYIFPGGMLINPKNLENLCADNNLVIKSQSWHGGDYARTMRQWQDNFATAWPQIAKLGFDTKFKRLWDYYLAYCIAGFEHGLCDLTQLTVQRPGARQGG